jgi:hypothetical protein
VAKINRWALAAASGLIILTSTLAAYVGYLAGGQFSQ